MYPSKILKDEHTIYLRIVASSRLHKTETYRVKSTVSGIE